MRARLSVIALGCTLFVSLTALAQTPSKPSNATGQCKDGSYWTGATKSGACRGHQGVQTWYGASSNTATAAAPAAPAPAPKAAPAAAPAPAPRAASTAAKPSPTAAPGGGPGMVWVNTSTKVYH